MLFFPISPSGNFFNNWLSISIFYPHLDSIYFINIQKNKLVIFVINKYFCLTK